MRRRFFVERFDGTTAALRGEAAHHLGRVLRAQPGQLYELSNGEALWLARIEHAGRDAVEFALVEPLPARTPSLHVTLLLAIIKFDRFEWSLEKATELGVAEIVPLAAARSEKSLVAAAAKRAARWQKILLESAQHRLRILEIPARHRRRRGGKSKIAGFCPSGPRRHPFAPPWKERKRRLSRRPPHRRCWPWALKAAGPMRSFPRRALEDFWKSRLARTSYGPKPRSSPHWLP
ncbi:MAG: hypothetical protein DMG28_12305 [Acidobacteria bacterium]|nr:MAG: hypothetical protein DMG28_12305 [Acidobacteriota bacterium]